MKLSERSTAGSETSQSNPRVYCSTGTPWRETLCCNKSQICNTKSFSDYSPIDYILDCASRAFQTGNKIFPIRLDQPLNDLVLHLRISLSHRICSHSEMVFFLHKWLDNLHRIRYPIATGGIGERILEVVVYI